MAIADDLHLDMPGIPDQTLGIDAVIAEAGLGFGLAARIGIVDIGCALDHAHAATAAPGHRLDHDCRVVAERGEERLDLLQRRWPGGAGDDRHAAAPGELLCRDLVAEQFKRRGRRADKDDPFIGAALREIGIFT